MTPETIKITQPTYPLWNYPELKAEFNPDMKLPDSAACRGLELLQGAKVSTDGESFWVTVVGLMIGDMMIGRVDNDLIQTKHHGLKRGDLIAFSPQNVCAIEERKAAT